MPDIPDDVKAGIQVLRDIGAGDIADGIEADWSRSFWEHPEKHDPPVNRPNVLLHLANSQRSIRNADDEFSHLLDIIRTQARLALDGMPEGTASFDHVTNILLLVCDDSEAKPGGGMLSHWADRE